MDIKNIAQNPREIKALQLVASGAVRQLADAHRYAVKSQSSNDEYVVDLSRSQPSCTCKDMKYRPGVCKHALAARRYRDLPLELSKFMNERENVDEAIMRNTFTREIRFYEKHMIFNPVEAATFWYAKAALLTLDRIQAMEQPTEQPQPQPQTEQKRALMFQLRYWWDGHPENLLDPIKQIQWNEDEIKRADVRVKGPKDADFRPLAGTLPKLVEYIDDNSLRLGKPQHLQTRSGTTYWEGEYIIPVYKTVGE